MKDYLAPPKPVSPCSDQKIKAYLAQGLTIKKCSHGQSGGLDPIFKSMMNPKSKKIAQRKFNQRRTQYDSFK
jgi:hypothetical protein